MVGLQDGRVGVAPVRFVNVSEAERRHGHRVERLAPYLTRTDPLADDVVTAFHKLPAGRGHQMLNRALDHGIAAVPDAPPALVALFAQVDRVPMWVEWDELNLGGAMFLRCGIFGAVILACFSLPYMYSMPDACKPLVFSGRLVQRSARRMSETGHFVLEICRPDGLKRHGEGFKISVKVRLMHAQVRGLLLRSGRWRGDDWGAPINQADMAGTSIAMSVVMLNGLSRWGFSFSEREKEAVVQLWRYASHLLGVEDELQTARYAEAERLRRLTEETQRDPDDDSRGLAGALMRCELPPPVAWLPRYPGLYYALARSLLGDTRAEGLGFPRSRWALALPIVRAVTRAADLCRRALPGGTTFAVRAGTRMWERALAAGLAGAAADYLPPQQLGKLASPAGDRVPERA